MIDIRNQSFAHRPMIMSTRGVVATGHPLATAAGLQILLEGGNAVDAAVAAATAVSIVRPTMGGPGGDVFMQIYRPGMSVPVALNGSGAAPMAATLDAFPNGMPMQDIRVASVPGAVDAWVTAAERFGTMDLRRLLAPAIRLARHGIPTTEQLSKRLTRDLATFSRQPEAARTFLPNGRPPSPGEIFRQPNLASTYEAIAEGGRDAFYRGDIARRIVETSRELGGFFALEDLARHQTQVLEPISTRYRDYTLCEQPPVSQGIAVLEALNILDNLSGDDFARYDADAVHLQVEATKCALVDKAASLGDPAFVPSAVPWLLDRGRAADLARAIDPRRASDRYPTMLNKDTTYLCVVDEKGMAVSHIQSLFHGSGVVAVGTGVQLNARMTYFSLDPSHPNCLAPGKRTIHTLNTYMAFRDGRLAIVGGSPGGDGQVQTNIQVLMNLIDRGMGVQDAIEAPRWVLSPRRRDRAAPSLCLELGVPRDLAADLEARGHPVEYVGAWTRFGGAQAIVVDPDTGVRMGGADPRREAYAIGY